MKFSIFKKGFTLIELLVVIGTVVILIGLAVPAFRVFQKESDLNNSVEGIINNLRIAQNKTLASEGASQYGIYFSTSTTPHQYTLFKGSDYDSRDITFDEIHQLPKTVEISDMALGGGREIVFQRLSGETAQVGNLTLRLVQDTLKQKNIYIEQSGLVSWNSSPGPSDESRLKDSRHIHIDYSRLITTSTEKLILTSGVSTKEIIIADNLKDNQIYWEGDFDVAGSIQKLKIQTHRLNNPDSQFSINRDRRYNNQLLKINLSGDPSGNIIEYSADGLSTFKTSIYATDPQWQ